MTALRLYAGFSSTTVALYSKPVGMSSARDRVMRLERTPESVTFAKQQAAAAELYEALKRWQQYAKDNLYSTDPADPSYCSFLGDTDDAIAAVER